MRKFISSVPNPFRNIRWKCNGTWFASQVSSVIFGAYNVVCFTRKMRNNEMPTEFVVWLHWLKERERNKVQSLIQILRKHHTFGTLRVRWDNKRALWGMWQANQRGCSSIRQGIDVYISIGKRLFGLCVFLAESEKWNIARYLPISLRYSHEKRLSNKYCAVCCAACWQTRRGNCNRMLIKLVRIIYVWYVRSII